MSTNEKAVKITADTITDDQIRALREQLWADYASACHALGFEPHHGIKVPVERQDRARCAEILNATEAEAQAKADADFLASKRREGRARYVAQAAAYYQSVLDADGSEVKP